MSTVKHKKIGDMQKSHIAGKYQTTKITHYDGNTRVLHYTDIETPFPQGKKIISVSDIDGYITHANSTFVKMSGYAKQELIGSPHYLLHHPDMPKAAFKGLWDELASRGRWQGYVKNLRKDGGYYWVHASIISLQRHGKLVGYTSARQPASREDIDSHAQLYKKMLAQE